MAAGAPAALAPARWLQAAELACALWPYCYQRGYYSEARAWFERSLGAPAEISQTARIGVRTRTTRSLERW